MQVFGNIKGSLYKTIVPRMLEVYEVQEPLNIVDELPLLNTGCSFKIDTLGL